MTTTKSLLAAALLSSLASPALAQGNGIGVSM